MHNHSSIAGTSVLHPGCNIILISVSAYSVGVKTLLYERYLVLYSVYFGLCAAKMTNRLIIASMTKSEIRVTDPALWSIAALGINQYWNMPVNEDVLFFLVLFYVGFDLLRFLFRTYRQIAQFLQTNVLFVK